MPRPPQLPARKRGKGTMGTHTRALALAIAVLTITAACQGSSTAPSGTSPAGGASSGAPASQVRWGGTMIYAEYQDLPECNPTISSQQVSYHNVFDGLARYNAKFELKPELAESWTFA